MIISQGYPMWAVWLHPGGGRDPDNCHQAPELDDLGMGPVIAWDVDEDDHPSMIPIIVKDYGDWGMSDALSVESYATFTSEAAARGNLRARQDAIENYWSKHALCKDPDNCLFPRANPFKGGS